MLRNFSGFLFYAAFLFYPTFLNSQWVIQNVNTADNLKSVHYYSGNNIYIGRTANLTYTTNSGVTWNHQPVVDAAGTPIPGILYDIYFTSPTAGLSVGSLFMANSQVVLGTSNTGTNWSVPYSTNIGTYPRLCNKLWFGTPSTGYAVGSNGKILRTSDYGATWAVQTSNTTTELYGVEFATNNLGLACGDSQILRTTNGGLTWSGIAEPGVIKEVWMEDGLLVSYAAGMNGTAGVFYRSYNQGLTWTSVPNPFNGDVYAVEGKGFDTVYVASGNRLYFSANAGGVWYYFPSTVGYILNDLDFLGNSDSAYAVGNNGIVLKTTNNGGAQLAPVSVFTPTSGTSVCEGNSLSFTNNGSSSWTFEWLLDNTTVTTTMNATITFPVPGVHQVRLVSYNGVYRDTASMQITVNPLPLAPAPNLTASFNPICPNTNTLVQVPNSMTGVTYLLRNNTTPVGTTQIGNGGTLNFNTGGLPTTTTFNIYAVANNSCGTISSTTNITIVVDAINQSLPVTAVQDTICTGTAASVIVNNSVSGVTYRLRVGTTLVGNPQPGNGGNLSFSTGILNNTTTFNIYATNTINCSAMLTQTKTIVVSSVSAQTGITASYLNSNTPYTFTNSSVGSSFNWNFGPNASPATSSLQNPTVTFLNSGAQQINLDVLSASGCLDHDSANVTICNIPTSGQGVNCMDKNNQFRYGFGCTGYEVLDYCTDIFGNTYATGHFDTTFSYIKYNLFVMKFDPNGNILWQYKVNPFLYQSNGYVSSIGTAICADSSGNVYVGGSFAANFISIGSLNFASAGSQNVPRSFLVKFSPSGTPLWKIESGSTVGQPIPGGITDIYCRNNNSIYFSYIGSDYTRMIYPNSVQTNNLTVNVAHCDGSGHFISAVHADNTSYASTPYFFYYNPCSSAFQGDRYAFISPKLAVTADTLYLAGMIGASYAFGTYPITTTTYNTGYIAKLNMNTMTWLGVYKTFASSRVPDHLFGYMAAEPVFTTDEFGNVYLAWNYGSLSQSYSTSIGTNSYGNTALSFVSKYNWNGTVQWVNQTYIPNEIKSLVTLSTGELVGYGQSAATYLPNSDFATFPSQSGGIYGYPVPDSIDAFLFSSSYSGNLNWVRKIDGAGLQCAFELRKLNCEQVSLIGKSNRLTFFNGDTIATGYRNIFISKFSATPGCGIPVCISPLTSSISASQTIICTGNCLTLSATASGGTPPYSFNWMPGNLTGPSQYVCPTSTTNYQLTATDSNGLSFTSSQTVSVNLCTEVQDLNIQNLEIFPNPFKDKLNVTSTFPAIISIYNSLGQLSMIWNVNSGKNEIETGLLPPGIYILKVESTAGELWQKMVRIN